MKRKNFILPIIGLFVGVLSFSGCSTQKNYEMSYEQVISLLENQSQEFMDMFVNVDAQQKDLNVSTIIDTDDMSLDINVQSQMKVDYSSDFTEDLSLSFQAGIRVPESELDVTASWALNYSLIGNDMYLKLSKFALKWPSAKDLAMVTMIVNGFKWQRFKLNKSGANMSKVFTSYKTYVEELKQVADSAWSMMINEWSVVYDWMFNQYKWYNAWKYSVDQEKFDEVLHVYLDTMTRFYSWFFNQYAGNLWTSSEELQSLDFSEMLSWITYDNLQWYLVIDWKNEVVETMEGAHMNIDGTWFTFNCYYWKDWIYMDVKTDDWENVMTVLAKKNGKKYDVDADMMSIFKIKWDVKLNKFSKKDWIDADFDLDISMNTEGMGESDESVKEINIDMPLKWNYKAKSINSFTLQAPSDAVDLMDMLGGYLWASMGGDDEYREDDEYEYLDDEGYDVVDVPVITEESED